MKNKEGFALSSSLTIVAFVVGACPISFLQIELCLTVHCSAPKTMLAARACPRLGLEYFRL